MADYVLQFSCILDVGSAQNAERAQDIRETLAAEIEQRDERDLGFAMDIDLATGPGALWLHAEVDGDTEHVTAFVLRCAAAFGLTGLWGFCWALTCSRPRLDGFGGGAQVLDLGAGRRVGWTDCADWLDRQIAPNAAAGGELPEA